MYPWEELRKDILEFGTRNSLLIAPMPTASTSQILNNTESFEPLTSNFYVRRTQNGEYYIINRCLQKILNGTELWDKEMHENLIFHKGSVMNNDKIPKFLKEIFRTVWEIPQKHCLDMASDRQRFIDQSQSMNIYLTNPSIDILTKIIFYGWKRQLKTGNYYVRTRALTSSQNFFLDAEKEEKYKACESCSG
jgi:ribonucleotide reductase alpha subunit